MKNSFIKRTFLYAATMLPVASVALAAESKLTDLMNENARRRPDSGKCRKENLRSGLMTVAAATNPQVVRAKHAIFPALIIRTDWESARERFADANLDLSEFEAAIEFERAIRLLQECGMITINDSEIISSIPSTF